MPDTDFTIPLARLDEVSAKLREGVNAQPMIDGVGRVLNNLWDAVAPYPPATEANQPGRFSIHPHVSKARGKLSGNEYLNEIKPVPMGYYERGRGWWYPVVQKETLGAHISKARGAMRAPGYVRSASRVVGYKLAGGGKSEALGRHWTMNVSASSAQITGALMNAATYARFVQGDQQARFHGARGWRTVRQVAETQREEMISILQDAVTEYLKP